MPTERPSAATGLWGADVFIHVLQDVLGARMASLSGTFLSKVFEGPYRLVHQWMKTMKAYVTAQGKRHGKMYCCYTTCPRCAKKYGKNYVVLLAQVRAGVWLGSQLCDARLGRLARVRGCRRGGASPPVTARICARAFLGRCGLSPRQG